MTEDDCPNNIDGKRCGGTGQAVWDFQGRGRLKCVRCGHVFGGPIEKEQGPTQASKRTTGPTRTTIMSGPAMCEAQLALRTPDRHRFAAAAI
jgi:hypothetical protein